MVRKRERCERGGRVIDNSNQGHSLKSVGLEELVGLGTSKASKQIFGHLVIFNSSVLLLILLISVEGTQCYFVRT